jgi:uncharacterized protein YidB (DUF937 family)
MGLLDSITGLLGQTQAGQSHPELLNIVTGLLNNDSADGASVGGLSGLVQKFQQGGMGDVVNSWIANGHNLPISADQLHAVLGSDTVNALVERTGLSHSELLGQLSQFLPQIVDHLTPNGQVPAASADPSAALGSGAMGEIGNLLGGLLKR